MKLFLSILISVSLTVLSTAGCGKQESNVTESPAKSENQAAAASGPEPLTLPITKDKITLKLFVSLDAKSAATIKSYNEMLSFQELEKRTNIRIDFIHPPAGQEKEHFNLILASADYPDIISQDWSNYPGGPEKVLNDGIVTELKSYLDKYAPNFTKLLNDNPDIKKDIMTDTKKFHTFPFLRVEKTQRLSDGFQIRRDWLDKLGLQLPTTMDEWYNVLTAFKQKDPNGNGKADELPFIAQKLSGGSNSLSNFTCGWGMTYGFYRDNGKVKFGPAEPQYKEFLQTMNKWFKQGLIDPDFLSTDSKGFDSKVTGELGGSYFGLLNGNMGRFTGLMKDKNPKFLLSEVPYPKTSDGKSYNFTTGAARGAPGGGYSIGSKNKYIKETVKWLDYWYSAEGIILMNFGLEGKTFVMENGSPKYTDLIMNNPDGLPLDQALNKYTVASTSGRLFQDPRYWNQIMAYPNQREAMKILSAASTERTIPPITATPDESKKLATIINEINTYVDEKTTKFIMGQEPLENFDKYMSDLKNMGMDDALKIQQSALDRYDKR